MLRKRLPLFSFLAAFTVMAAASSGNAFALTNAEKLSGAREACTDRVFQMIREERDVYRALQEEKDWSVVGQQTAKTSDLVPYLVLNYHALSCRLRALCDTVAFSHGHLGKDEAVLPARPLGCSRLLMARGRWWSPDRREQGFVPEKIPECAYSELAPRDAEDTFGVTTSYVTVASQCAAWTAQILEEERQMLRLLVAQDALQRGTQLSAGIFQAVLRDIRDSFLEPLRGVVDLFGSVMHPIPCLLTQCN